MVERRMWLSMSPLHQFKQMSMEVIKKVEKKDFSWEKYFDLNLRICWNSQSWKLILKFIHQFPKLELVTYVQPITRSLLRVELKRMKKFMVRLKLFGV